MPFPTSPREAFWRDLMRRYENRIRAYARTVRCGDDEIDEIVWNVWDDAVAVEEQLAVASDPWDVLLPLVRRACASTMLRLRHEQPLEGDVAFIPRRDDDEISLRIRIDEFLRRLPEQQRRAVDLRFRSEWPYWAIAAALNVAEATVRVHVSRGLHPLRQLIRGGHL